VKISTIIIAKNEADNLKKTLPRLHWCDDIVVIDDNSTDETAQIAAAFKARVFKRSFDGFGPQKQFAVTQTVNEWVLNIDADEYLSDALIEELNQLSPPAKTDAFQIPIQHVFLGKVFKYGKESSYPHTRLFNKQTANFDDAIVHEKVKHNEQLGKLKGRILHYSYRDKAHYFEKLEKYAQQGAIKLKAKGKRRPLWLSYTLYPIYFLKHYLVYGNILNGYAGFTWSYLSAWYHTLKYIKLYQLNHE
jgi:glycosyltransferase involved in cell wall biosynthesis